jgi:hypothetical protein
MSVPGSQMRAIAAEAWPLAGPVRLTAIAIGLGLLVKGLRPAKNRPRPSPRSFLNAARQQPAAFPASWSESQSKKIPKPSDLRAQQADQSLSQPILQTLHISCWFLSQPIRWQHVTLLAG